MSNLQHLSIWERIGLGLALIFCRILSGILFFVLSKIWHYRSKVVFDNLAASFPELSADQIKQTARSYFRHLADLIAESLLIAHLTDRQLRALTRFENINLIQKLLREQKSIVLVASHVGNWEYLHLLPALTGCEVFAAYSPVTNQWIDKAFMQMRSRFGVQLIAKRDWYRFVLQRREKQPAIFITIADQRPEKPGEHCIHFLNQKTFFQPGAARLASKLDCALVYLDVTQTARNAYNFRFELISSSALNQDEGYLMQCYAQRLETTIRRHPELWLWSHKRWQFRLRQETPKPSQVAIFT